MRDLDVGKNGAVIKEVNKRTIVPGVMGDSSGI